MLRDSVVMGICLGPTLPVLAGAQAPAPPSLREPAAPAAQRSSADENDDAVTCDTEAQVQEPDDPRWRWRLRAYHHRDCVMSLVDEALGGQPDRQDTGKANAPDQVVMSRDDLERIRMLAWWARDAAARIGR